MLIAEADGELADLVIVELVVPRAMLYSVTSDLGSSSERICDETVNEFRIRTKSTECSRFSVRLFRRAVQEVITLTLLLAQW